MKLKDNRGFTAVDVSVSIVIIIIFVSLIASAYYNYYISNASIARNSAALSYAIDVIEAVELMDYSEVTDASVKTKLQDMYNNSEIAKPYEITTQVVKYNQTTGNTAKQDLIKILTVKVEYTVGNRTQAFDISRLIVNRS